MFACSFLAGGNKTPIRPNNTILQTYGGYSGISGAGIDSTGNLVIGGDNIFGVKEYSGLTTTLSGREIATGNNTNATIAFDENDNPIIYLQSSGNNVRKYDGDTWSDTPIDGFIAQNNGFIHFGGGLMLGGDAIGQGDGSIWRYSGFTANVSLELTGFATVDVVGTDGVNLYSYTQSNRTVTVHKGFSSQVSYSFITNTMGSDVKALMFYNGNLYIADTTAVYKMANS